MSTKRKRPSGRPGRADHDRPGTVVPLRRSGNPARRARTAALDRFAAWFDSDLRPDLVLDDVLPAAAVDPAEEVPSGRAVAGILDAVLGAASAEIAGLDLPHPRATSLAQVLVDVAERGDATMLAAASYAVDAYLHHLEAVGGWVGTAAELEDAIALAHALLDEAEDGALLDQLIDDEAYPVVPHDAGDVAARLAAIEASPVVSAVPQLLAWIGSSRPVTGTGVLRRVDIEPAAALLGVAAVGVAARRPTGPPASSQPELALELAPELPGDRPDAQPAVGDAVRVTAMRDVPELDSWWTALVATGVLDLTRTTVHPGPGARSWGHADPAVRLELRQALVAAVVARNVDQEGGGLGTDWLPPTWLDRMHLIALATRPDVAPGRATFEVLGPDVDDPQDSAAASAGSRPTDDDDDDGDPDGLPGSLLRELLVARGTAFLDRLVRLGIVEPHQTDGGIRHVAPDGLRPAVVAGLRLAQDRR